MSVICILSLFQPNGDSVVHRYDVFMIRAHRPIAKGTHLQNANLIIVTAPFSGTNRAD